MLLCLFVCVPQPAEEVLKLRYLQPTVSMSTQAACAGQTSIQQFPASLQAAIFGLCDSGSQNSLAQTCQVFWRMYHRLLCVPHDDKSSLEDLHTACWMWRREASRLAATTLGNQLRADLEFKSLHSTLYPDINKCYHATLRGYFSQCQLQFILQQPQGLKHLSTWFSEAAATEFGEKIQVEMSPSLPTAQIVIFTVKVYHNRQAGFSDDQLDKLGDMFGSLPNHVALYFAENIDHVIFICEPRWQLISPSGHASCVSWHMDCVGSVDLVIELPLL